MTPSAIVERHLRSSLGLVVGACMAAAAAQSAPGLSVLTVPADNVPVGCRLKPSDPTPSAAPTPTPIGRGNINVTATAPILEPRFPSNPWVGIGRLAFVVRTEIERSPQMPDAPRPDQREKARLEAQWMDNVVEAYHALYVSGESGTVQVSAIRFNDANQATLDLSEATLPSRQTTLPGRQNRGLRLFRGTAVVRLSGNAPSPCFSAIDKYIESLK